MMSLRQQKLAHLPLQGQPAQHPLCHQGHHLQSRQCLHRWSRPNAWRSNSAASTNDRASDDSPNAADGTSDDSSNAVASTNDDASDDIPNACSSNGASPNDDAWDASTNASTTYDACRECEASINDRPICA